MLDITMVHSCPRNIIIFLISFSNYLVCAFAFSTSRDDLKLLTHLKNYNASPDVEKYIQIS